MDERNNTVLKDQTEPKVILLPDTLSSYPQLTAEPWKKRSPRSLPEDGIRRLLEGNQRFIAGKTDLTNRDARRRAEIAHGQRPFAIVVGCSDSRVVPEIVFDQGLGDIFVVRTAGEVDLGSIEYAVDHLGVSLIIVLGHNRCGAVSAAVAGEK